ncbi:hypothetical protein QR685DRAFT_574623 [Neurospora intermedia]|uniref:Uncharacterized protein n=1 Tax=Neurospora intermedia TaxID=5142 RepID=A0ABR3D394_NEUIN
MRIDHQINAQEVHARSYMGLAIRRIQPFVRIGHVNTSFVCNRIGVTGRRKRSHATVGKTVVQLQAETGRWAFFPTGSSHPNGKSRTLVLGEQGRTDLLGH